MSGIQALQYLKALYNSGEVGQIGHKAAAVCSAVALVMDRVNWRPVGLWNQQLQDMAGINHRDQLRAAVVKAMEAGWLKCERANTRAQAIYTCIIPDGYCQQMLADPMANRGANHMADLMANEGANRGANHMAPPSPSRPFPSHPDERFWKQELTNLKTAGAKIVASNQADWVDLLSRYNAEAVHAALQALVKAGKETWPAEVAGECVRRDASHGQAAKAKRLAFEREWQEMSERAEAEVQEGDPRWPRVRIILARESPMRPDLDDLRHLLDEQRP